MSTRRASRAAWSIWALCVSLFIASGLFRILNWSTPTEEAREPFALSIGFLLLFLAFSTVGALVASRQPGNPIGWTFCALGLAGPLGAASEEYGIYALETRPESLPGGELLTWLGAQLLGPSFVGLVAFVFLLFPDGRLLSRRWRTVAWANGVALVLIFAWGFKPGAIDNTTLVEIRNPVGIEGAGTALDALGATGFVLMLAALVAAAVSLVLRLRRSRGDERLQLKWLALAGAVFAAIFLSGPVWWVIPALEDTMVWPVLALLGVSTIPIATGIAMLRYRLYDVDVVINRTLVYGALTATLAGVYVGSVLVLQLALSGVTEGSGLAVAGSTLAVAALFRPARERIQGLVDRRFYRRKYDATQTLEAFSARLRDEVDLDALGVELRAVVQDTMQPAHVSLWLRSARERR